MAKVIIDTDKCKGCGLCVFYCPLKSLELSSSLNKRGVKAASFKKDAKCSGCGFCFLICPDNCIQIDKENGKK
ncbi:MAG: 4Fe-4S binding protein [Candidatus Susulua stagnicola]|nr:4Fe-4S binding protein [Candidatus Susulua stagnicola]